MASSYRCGVLVALGLFGWINSAQMVFAQSTRPSVAGRVTSADGKAVGGAKVYLFGEFVFPDDYQLVTTTTTDAAGQFKIEHDRAREFVLAVQSANDPLFVTSVAGDIEEEPLEIHLRRPISVRIHAVDSAGAAIAGARIAPRMILAADSFGGGFVPHILRDQLAQTTDAAGQCTFDNLPQGQRVILGAADGWQAARLAVQTRRQAAMEVTEPIIVSESAVLECRVLMPDGKTPATELNVWDNIVMLGGVRSSEIGRTDPKGILRFTHVPAGQHTLRIQTPFPLNREAATTTLGPIQIDAGPLPKQMEIRLERGVEVSGHAIFDGNGNPAPGAKISITRKTGDRSSEGVGDMTTGDDGSFVVRVLPGEYALRISNYSSGPIIETSTKAEVFPVEPGKPATADIRVRENPILQRNHVGKLQGIALDSQSRPVEGAQVWITAAPYNDFEIGIMNGAGNSAAALGNGLATTTDAAGHFSFDAVGDTALLAVRKGSLALESRVTIGADRDLRLLLRDDTAGSATIHVVDENNKPVAGAELAMITGDGRHRFAPRQGVTDANGDFTFSAVHPDRHYRVHVSGVGLTSGDREFDVEARKTTAVLPIQIARAESAIAGVVKDSAGNVLPLVNVTVYDRRSGASATTTDMQGRFRVEGLVANDYVGVETRYKNTTSERTPVQNGTEDVVIIHRPPANEPPVPMTRPPSPTAN